MYAYRPPGPTTISVKPGIARVGGVCGGYNSVLAVHREDGQCAVVPSGFIEEASAWMDGHALLSYLPGVVETREKS